MHELKTADYALIVSICSATLSLAGFIWNVWSKFIFPQPALRPRLHLSTLIDINTPGHTEEKKIVRLYAVNHGQTTVTVSNVLLKIKQSNGRETRAQAWALVNPHWSSEVGLNPGFPKNVARGENCESAFPFAADSVFRRGVTAIGFCDTLGKEWWAPSRDLQRLKSLLREAFPAAWTSQELAEAQMKA